MLHKVDFAGAIGVPEVDGKHVEGGVNFTDEAAVSGPFKIKPMYEANPKHT